MMLISAGADTIIQKATTGEVNWEEVAVSGVPGGVGGSSAIAAKAGATGLKAAMISGACSGAIGGAGSGCSYMRSPSPHSVGGFLLATGEGAGAGAVMGGAGGAAGHGIVAGAGRLLGDVHPAPTELPASEIRFSQRSVSDVSEIEQSMRADGWVGDPIDVVRMRDGGLTSVDNTHLLAAKRSGINVQANLHEFEDGLPDHLADRFATKKGELPSTWGEAATSRINNQGAAYRNANPHGSWVTGWDGN